MIGGTAECAALFRRVGPSVIGPLPIGWNGPM